MTRSLKWALLITDWLLLCYWILSGLAQLGWLPIPRVWLYTDYNQAQVVAWNWSFLPLDLAFSILGLYAVSAARRGLARWRPLAMLSLSFTMAAGAMAIAYWTILGDLNPYWYIANLALLVWPLFFMPALIRQLAGTEDAL